MKRCLTPSFWAAVLWFLCATTEQAQAEFMVHPPVYTGTPLMISAGVVTQQTLNQQLSTTNHSGPGRSKKQRSSTSAQSASDRTETRSTLLVGSAQTGVPAKMAAHFPAAARPEAERVYREMLDKHPQLMRQLGVPANDVAAAAATFLAGSYIAYRGVDFPDEHFKPLYKQMRGIIGTNDVFARAGNAERREMFEQMAILGTFMALTREALKQHPAPQTAVNMKLAAKGYLQQFMSIDPEHLRITEQGLIVNSFSPRN